MKILLIAPPFYRILGFYNRYFPFGVTVVATSLKDAGYDVKVYDADFFDNANSIDYSKIPEKYEEYLKSFDNKKNKIWKEVRETIKKYNPDIVGISTYTPFVASVLNTAKICKSVDSKIKVFVGGPHVTVKGEEIMSISKDIDFAIAGDGEESVVELIKSLEDKNVGLENIKGLLYKNKDVVVVNNKREFTKNIDKYPMPDRSLLMNEKRYSSEDMGLIMTSRGCPYRCTYCASTKGLSYRSVDNVIKEILHVKKTYNTRQFTFKDDSFTVDRKRIESLCNSLIKQKINIKWECNTRVNLIDLDLLKLMKKAGCNFIKVGIETGSERVLKSMDKGITLDNCRSAAALFRKVGIHWSGYFMMGVNGEKVEDIYSTLNFMKELNPNLAIMGIYEPFPGTKMFDEGIKLGLIKNDMSLDDFYSISPDNYYKINPNVQNDLIEPKVFKELEKTVLKEFHDHNKSFFNVLSMILAKTGVYFSDSKILIDDVKKYFRY